MIAEHGFCAATASFMPEQFQKLMAALTTAGGGGRGGGGGGGGRPEKAALAAERTWATVGRVGGAALEEEEEEEEEEEGEEVGDVMVVEDVLFDVEVASPVPAEREDTTVDKGAELSATEEDATTADAGP